MNKFDFVEGAPLKQFEQALTKEMEQHVKFFEKELTKINVGRAHSSMIEDVKVDSYGTLMPLKQLAAISIPDPTLLVVQPWDKGIMTEIEKALSASDLGMTPVNDGNVIRLQVPRISGERRAEIIKTLGKKAEEAKVALRNVRKDAHNLIREAEKAKKISEDYSKRTQDVLQKTTDKMIEMIEKTAQRKETEVKG